MCACRVSVTRSLANGTLCASLAGELDFTGNGSARMSATLAKNCLQVAPLAVFTLTPLWVRRIFTTVPSLRTQGVDFLKLREIWAQNHEKIFFTITYRTWNFSRKRT
jgi:hypothetical protein